MRHAREDYNRIQDPAGLIPEDEPVLLIRAQDKHSTKVAAYYANLVECDPDGGDPNIVKALRRHIPLIRAWPKKKSPDMPAPACTGRTEVTYSNRAVSFHCRPEPCWERRKWAPSPLVKYEIVKRPK